MEEHFFEVSAGGEGGEVVVVDFFGGWPEGLGGDLLGDPFGAGVGGVEVVVREKLPLVEGDVRLGGAEGEITRNGHHAIAAKDGEGVERELEVGPTEIGGLVIILTGIDGGSVVFEMGGEFGV